MIGENIIFTDIPTENITLNNLSTNKTRNNGMDHPLSNNRSTWPALENGDVKENTTLTGIELYKMSRDLINDTLKLRDVPIHEMPPRLSAETNLTNDTRMHLPVNGYVEQAGLDADDMFSVIMSCILLLILLVFTGHWFYDSRTRFVDAFIAFRGPTVNPVQQDHAQDQPVVIVDVQQDQAFVNVEHSNNDPVPAIVVDDIMPIEQSNGDTDRSVPDIQVKSQIKLNKLQR